jgi:glucose-6-phosphate 1-dehydrogenase
VGWVHGVPSVGPERTAERRELEARSTTPSFTPYAHLIQEMLKGDPMLFITSDEAEEAWRIVDPVMNAWSAGDVPLQEYPAGGAPPAPLFVRDTDRDSPRRAKRA